MRILPVIYRAFTRVFGRVDNINIGLRPAFQTAGPAPWWPINIHMTSKDRVDSTLDNLFYDQEIKIGGRVRGTKGPYQVISPFPPQGKGSEGGMSSLYVVKDRAGRELILKKRDDFAEHGPELQKESMIRFANEIRILSNITRHPQAEFNHVVELVDHAPCKKSLRQLSLDELMQADNEQLEYLVPQFYIMEKINGRDFLNSKPKSGTLPPKITLTTMIWVLRGLVAFREAAQLSMKSDQVAHRDLKPENIFLEAEGKRVKRAVIGDFGVAKIPESKLTGLRMIVGTIGYLAPEVILEGSSVVDQRADIFSIGAILYWALTGVEPFVELDLFTFASDPGYYIGKLRVGIAQRFRELEPGTLYHGITRKIWLRLWQITFKALDPDITKRHQNYEELAQELTEVYKDLSR